MEAILSAAAVIAIVCAVMQYRAARQAAAARDEAKREAEALRGELEALRAAGGKEAAPAGGESGGPTREELEAELRRLKKENRRLSRLERQARPREPKPAPKEFTKIIDRPNPRPEVQREEAPKPKPRMVTFGAWPPDVHHANGQKARFERARQKQCELVSMENHRAVVRGASGGIYHVTLNSCDCPDFAEHLKKQRPCKHIYYLALQLGFPLDDIFEE